MSSRPAGRTCCAGRPHSSRAWAATLPAAAQGGQAARAAQPGTGPGDRPVRGDGPAARRRPGGAGDRLEDSRAARALPAPADLRRPADLILDGLALLVTDGPAAAAPTSRHAANAVAGVGISEGEGLRRGRSPRRRQRLVGRGRLARHAACNAWFADHAGALDQLPIMLGRRRAPPRCGVATSPCCCALRSSRAGSGRSAQDREAGPPPPRRPSILAGPRGRADPVHRGHHCPGRGWRTGNAGGATATLEEVVAIWPTASAATRGSGGGPGTSARRRSTPDVLHVRALPSSSTPAHRQH